MPQISNAGDAEGKMSEAILDVKYHRLCVHPPVGKSKQYCTLMLTVIHAVEQGQPTDRDNISWKLITNLPVETIEDAVRKLTWYALRWKIETFH
ncbi:MAG: IS4 family transposase, partial [Bryobacteraceae bacterium]|nr:IS4 family transposase [Bryobacteraceae bacterium]